MNTLAKKHCNGMKSVVSQKIDYCEQFLNNKMEPKQVRMLFKKSNWQAIVSLEVKIKWLPTYLRSQRLPCQQMCSHTYKSFKL